MAPNRTPRDHDVSLSPLADFFWIAGVDGQDVLETYIKLGAVKNGANGTHAQGYGATIAEHGAAEDGETSSILESPRPDSRRSKRNSYQRLSRLSDEAQMSIRSLDNVVSDTGSKRSSVTIRAVPSPGPQMSRTLSDADFDKALNQFAVDRDSFFLDLNFNAGAITRPSRPSRPRPKTRKIVGEDVQPQLSKGIGSLRRHMSFRDTIRRQPSVARQGLLDPCVHVLVCI
jgi:hypothetical protein